MQFAGYNFPGLPWGHTSSSGRGGDVAGRVSSVPSGPLPRWTHWPQAVTAQASFGGVGGRTIMSRAPLGNDYGTRGANVMNPLIGRPGFSYVSHVPHQRLGPIPKLSPGSGQTGVPGSRAGGFVPAAFASQQYMDATQFDYLPPTDFTVDQGTTDQTFPTLPRTINVGDDGIALLGTYRAHDFAVPSRFFEQGRSAGYWQDQSFGPEYRYLVPAQQVARYNLFNDIAMARQLSPNAYFLPYQTQPAVAAQTTGNGMGRPLGY